jgi:hypothetical protein
MHDVEFREARAEFTDFQLNDMHTAYSIGNVCLSLLGLLIPVPVLGLGVQSKVSIFRPSQDDWVRWGTLSPATSRATGHQMSFVYATSVFMVGVLQDFGHHCCFRDNLRSNQQYQMQWYNCLFCWTIQKQAGEKQQPEHW